MCRSIKPLFNFEPQASDDEIHSAALQYVRKLSGFQKPSHVNQHAFDEAVAEIAHATRHMIEHLETHVAPKNREAEARKKKARYAATMAESA